MGRVRVSTGNVKEWTDSHAFKSKEGKKGAKESDAAVR